ncbi:M23 family metallopeptidase [bacterium]|nr:M23 family metallopeptidase [bacterium]
MARFAELPESARFYSTLSALVLTVALASGLTVQHATDSTELNLNSRTPVFEHLSPWGRVLGNDRSGFLKPDFDLIGVVTPLPQDVSSCEYVASPGEDLEAIAGLHGIDLDLLASANSVSYARIPRRETDVSLPLLYSRSTSWDRSFEFLYPMSNEMPIGGNGKAKRGAPSIVRHAVARGECLWNIAKKYHVRMETIIGMNDLPSARYLRPGQILEIPDTDGTYCVVKRNDTISSLCKKYDVELADVVNANPGINVEALQIGQRVFVPGTGALEQLFRMAWPVYGRISSRYGYRIHPVYRRRMMHTGLDIAASHGTPIRAALTGRVKFAGWKGGYGRTLIIEHPNGYETLYAHCTKLLVGKGATVKRGDTIAKVGSTGVSTGPHVHFEVREHGKRINPEKVLY